MPPYRAFRAICTPGTSSRGSPASRTRRASATSTPTTGRSLRHNTLWAGDFHEGRAEVETPTGMGLIDRRGDYVIPPRYEIVEYDPATSVSRVRQNGRWALFDYLGRRLTPFGPLPDEE